MSASKWNEPIVKSSGVRGPVERHDHEPGDDRRQRERQVDDRVDDATSRAKESRTRTHAMIVPKTAFVSTASVERITRQLQRRDRLRRGDDRPRSPDQPFPVDFQTTAAIGSTTIDEQERRDEADLQGEGRRGPLPAVRGRRREPRRLGDGASCQWRTPSDCSICCMMLLLGSNHFLSTARQPPSSLFVIVVSPGRTGNLLPVLGERLLVHRAIAVLGEDLLGRVRLQVAREGVPLVLVLALL